MTQARKSSTRTRQTPIQSLDDRRCCAVRKLTRTAPYPQTR